MFKIFTKEASSENPTTVSRQPSIQCSAITCSRCRQEAARHPSFCAGHEQLPGAGRAGRAGRAHLKDGHGLGEVVLLHGGRGVESRQGVVELLQVAVAEASVVQVMTQARDQQSFALQENTTECTCLKPSSGWDAISASHAARMDWLLPRDSPPP